MWLFVRKVALSHTSVTLPSTPTTYTPSRPWTSGVLASWPTTPLLLAFLLFPGSVGPSPCGLCTPWAGGCSSDLLAQPPQVWPNPCGPSESVLCRVKDPGWSVLDGALLFGALRPSRDFDRRLLPRAAVSGSQAPAPGVGPVAAAGAEPETELGVSWSLLASHVFLLQGRGILIW